MARSAATLDGSSLVEVGEAIGNQPTPFRSTRRRHCRVESLLVKHMDEAHGADPEAHLGPLSEESDERVHRLEPRETLLCVRYGASTAIAASRESNSMP